MPIPIINIDVNDDKFQVFQARFDKYTTALKAMPGQWGSVDATLDDVVDTLATMTASMMAQNELLHAQTPQHEKMQKAVASSDKLFTTMSHNTKDVAKNILGATTSLLKWASLTSVFSGIIGSAGLFGIDRLALSASTARRSAQGLGTVTGDQRAFGLNYGRYVDPGSNLAAIADAKSDHTKQWAFMPMGVSQQDVQSKDPAALAVEMALKAKETFDRGDGSQQYAQSQGLLQFYTMDELRRLHAASVKDLQDSQTSYGADRKTFALGDDDLKKWQNLSTQIDRFGISIETVLIRDLTPLAPSLTHLSEAFTHAVDAFLSNPHLKDWIGDLAAGIDRLATYLGSDKVQDDFHHAIDWVAKFATAVGSAVAWVEDFIAHPADAMKRAVSGSSSLDPAAPPKEGEPGYGSGQGADRKSYRDFYDKTHPADTVANEKESWAFWKSKGASDAGAAAMMAQEAGESGFKPHSPGDPDKSGNPTADGSFQWHKDRRDKILASENIDVWSHDSTHLQQLQAMYAEMSKRLDPGAGRGFDRLFHSSSVDDSADSGVDDIERPGDRNGAKTTRRRLARQYMDVFAGHPADPVLASAEPPSRLAAMRKQLSQDVASAPHVDGRPEEPLPNPTLGTRPRSAVNTAGNIRIDIHNQTGGSASVSASQVPG